MTIANPKNILSLIEVDHRNVDRLVEKVHESDREADKYFNQIARELTLHSQAEERVFYPAMMEYEETKQYVGEARSEHTEVKILLLEMEKLNFSEAEFKLKMQELMQAVKHHVQEEENEIFPAVRQCMDDERLQKLGEEFQAAKAKLEPEVKVTAK